MKTLPHIDLFNKSTTAKMKLLRNNSFNKVQKRSMWNAIKHTMNSLKSKPKNATSIIHERNYAHRGFLLSPDAVDTKTGKPLDNDVTKNLNRVLVVETKTGEVQVGLTQSPAGPFENKVVEKRTGLPDQRVASPVDKIIIADKDLLKPAPKKAREMIARNKKKIEESAKEIRKEIEESGVETRTIILVHKDDIEQINEK